MSMSVVRVYDNNNRPIPVKVIDLPGVGLPAYKRLDLADSILQRASKSDLTPTEAVQLFSNYDTSNK